MKTSADQHKAALIRKFLNRSPRATALEAARGIKREFGLEVSPAVIAKARRESLAAPMAPASDLSKAELIRQVARSEGGKMRPRDVVAKLAEQGVSVSSAQVSTVLSSMGAKRKRRGGRRPAAVETVASTLTLESLIAAKKLADHLGSVEVAKQAVDALAKLS
jgi:hypothetical protein